jgi:hypothetical protein
VVGSYSGLNTHILGTENKSELWVHGMFEKSLVLITVFQNMFTYLTDMAFTGRNCSMFKCVSIVTLCIHNFNRNNVS